MQIDPVNVPASSVDPVQYVVPLEQRMLATTAPGEPDEAFERFYTQLLADIGVQLPTASTLREYLRDYTAADGTNPYNGSQKQMDVLTAVLQRMEADDLKGDPRYGALREGMVSVAMTNMFVNEFRLQIFNAEPDEDSRESANW